MSSRFDYLEKKGLVSDAPPFLKNSVCYEVVMGSVAYGVSNDSSDMDIYGFCIPPKDILFPYHNGNIYGFDTDFPKFDQYLKHHIQTDKNEYDITIYNICKFFSLVAQNNPNMVDSLFVPATCILYSNPIGNLVRENRHIFLHKGCWHKFKGYAFSQIKKASSQERIGKRADSVEKYGYDLKFGYHVVRLILEVEQILAEQDLDLQRHKEQLKAIRQGHWSLKQIEDFFSEKEKQLEKLYHESKLPYSPDITEIRNLLGKCINMYFSDNILQVEEKIYKEAIEKIRQIANGLV